MSQLVFSVTNRCTARCVDCPIVHENMPPASLDAEFMIDLTRQLLPLNSLKLVVFTGGEPLLLLDDVRRTIAFVSSHGLWTRIVTNGFWATSKERAKSVLQSLQEVGLTELNLSCDDYHQEFIPLEYIKNANEAACELGVPALLAHRLCPGGRITPEFLSGYLGVPLQEFREGKPNPDNNAIQTGRNVPIKSGVLEPHDGKLEAATPWTGPCSSVLSKIVISPRKEVEICCGIASSSIQDFYLGSLENENLFRLLQRGNEDLITNWLALAGPASILDFVRSKDGNLELPSHYANKCHLCNELFTREEVRQILKEHGQEQAEMIGVLREVLEWANRSLISPKRVHGQPA